METQVNPDLDVAVETATKFLTTIFDPNDVVLFRPIETWTEGGKKKSLVDYKNTSYRRADPGFIRTAIRLLIKSSEKEQTNLFFGVCSRFGREGEFDLAWQIRTVRVLWTDIDHVTVDEAQQRVVKSGLPQPSVIVNSGNGVHLYWILDEPFLINDVGNPMPVKTEWVELPGGRKKPKKYILEAGEKVYLDNRRHFSRLSPHAEKIQDLLTGIAQAIGGDHTTDLSRLLRIPGTLNRKDQKNGREPLLTHLVECEPTRRYSIATFEPFAKPAPEVERVRKIDTMPLPKPRKPSASKTDKLAERIAACVVAQAGSRSETDFSLCCFAIKNGFDKETVWSQVEHVGKFAEGGRRYFDLTWEHAEFETKSEVYDKILDQNTKKGSIKPTTPPSGEGDGSPKNEVDLSTATPTISIDTANIPVSTTLGEITNYLLSAKNCFLRTEQLVVIRSDMIATILTPTELGGLLNEMVEFYFIGGEDGEYKPLPPAYGGTWLNHHRERHRLPEIKLFTRNPVFTEDWRLVAPGFDAATGIYYTGTLVPSRRGTTHLDAMLQDFCFRSPGDRTNFLGMLLTGILIPHFIGAKPAALFNGNQPGLGKSILAQIIAILRDGHPTETASYNPNDEEFEKRLGSIVHRGVTTIIIDNAKGHGRKPRIESACLERSITDPVLSFRLLGKSLEIRAENSHIFCVTANTPDVSLDLVTRSVVINLEYEGDPRRRKFHVSDPETYALQYRSELLGELIGMVELWFASGKPLADVNTRFNKRGWGNIVGGILQANREPDFLANSEDAAVELDETRREFTELITTLAAHQQGTWTAAELVGLCQQDGLLHADLGEGTPKSLSTKLGTLAGRYVNEKFSIVDGRVAVFHRQKSRMGNIYRVSVSDECAEPAEPLRT